MASNSGLSVAPSSRPACGVLTIDTSGAVQVRTDACLYGQPGAFGVVAATAGEMGLRGRGIEGLMGRWVGGTMPEAARGCSDITDLYGEAFGVPPVGRRVFIRTRQLINGWEDDFKETWADVPPPGQPGS